MVAYFKWVYVFMLWQHFYGFCDGRKHKSHLHQIGHGNISSKRSVADDSLRNDVFAIDDNPRDTIPQINATTEELAQLRVNITNELLGLPITKSNDSIRNDTLLQDGAINITKTEYNTTSPSEIVFNNIGKNVSDNFGADTSKNVSNAFDDIQIFLTNDTDLSPQENVTAKPSTRNFISSTQNISSEDSVRDTVTPSQVNSNESNQETSSVNWNNEPIISDPVPIRNFIGDKNTLITLPLNDLLSENTIKPLSIELTRYKNESNLVLNATKSANKTQGFSADNKTSSETQTGLMSDENLTPVIGPDVFAALSTNLQQDVLDLWPYRDYIKGPGDLMLDQGLINRAKLNTGSGKRLRKIFERGVRGQHVHAALISSSVSRAFLKDPTSKRWLYPNALVNWWAKVVSPITRSQMILQDVSISGIGSDYFSRCLKTHLQDNGQTDLILWELSGSDYKPGGVLKPPDAEAFEHFLRNVLEYKSSPEVVLLNFFRGNHWNKTAYCRELDESKEELLSRYYDCTALSWSKSICPYLKDDEEGFSYSYLFSRDQTHPSIIGHAQMAYILIDFLRDEFLKFLEEHKSSKYFSRSVIMPLPKSLYSEQDFKTLCYSTLKAVDDPPDAEGSNLPVIFIAPEPYEDAAHRSHIAKYIYKPVMKTMIMRVTIPGSKTDLLKRTISIMPYFNQPARTMLRIDNHPFTELKINNFNRGKILKVEPSMLLSGGDHMVRIWSLDKQFKVLALTIDD